MKLNTLLTAAALLTASLSATAGTLTVEFVVPEGSDGKIFAGVYDAADKFPKKGAEKMGQIAPAKGSRVTVVFSDVAPGNYAISAFLDRNGNEVLDTNLLGIPKGAVWLQSQCTRHDGPPGIHRSGHRA